MSYTFVSLLYLVNLMLTELIGWHMEIYFSSNDFDIDFGEQHILRAL